MKKSLLFLMLIVSVSLLGNAINQAQGLVEGKVLSASYGNDVKQKLFAVSDKGAYLFVKNGSSFSKLFSKTFKKGEKPYFRSAGFKDINNNRSLDFFYATVRNGKKTLYVINTKPKVGKYSIYQVVLSKSNKLHKSGNLKVNSPFHKWMSSKVKNLNENTSVNANNLDIQKRPPIRVIGSSNAMSTAAGLIDAKVLKAGFYTNRNQSKFLFAITATDAHLFISNGSNYNKFFSSKLKRRYTSVLSNVGIFDINGNGYGDFYYMLKNNNLKKILYVINTKPKTGKFSIYQVARNSRGGLNKSSNLKANSVYHNWMNKKLGGVQEVISTPVENKPKLSGDYIYLCDMSTNGIGAYKTGGSYCGISINDLKGYEIVFQQVYGPVKFVAAHERFKNGNWKVTYKGAMKNLRLSDVKKTNKSTHINFTLNGTNERYDRSVAKVRVYKKALIANIPTNQEAIEIFKRTVRLRRNDRVLKVFVYKENSQIKIAAITTRALHILVDVNYGTWKSILKQKIKLKNTKMNVQFNGMKDVDNDGVKDIYYSTVDNKKGYNLLNLFSVAKKNTYTAYAKLGEAIGDFDPEIEFKFTGNTPKNLHPWFKKMIFRFGFVKKPVEIAENEPKGAVRLWIRDNGFLNKNNELQLRFRMYNGDEDRNFVPSATKNPVVATITVNNIVYRSHYKGIVTAFNKGNNKSYVVYVPKMNRNFVSTFSYSGNKVFFGTQNNGIVIFNSNSNTLKNFNNKQLNNKDIWKISKKQNHYLVFTDSTRAIKIKARLLER